MMLHLHTTQIFGLVMQAPSSILRSLSPTTHSLDHRGHFANLFG